jgi:hypothetical protein
MRGQFAGLLHIRWLLEQGASRPVLAAQERGLADVYARVAHPMARSLFDQLRRGACLDQAMAAAAGLTAA